MNPAVRIEAGYYLIDTDAWIGQRVGDRDDEHTALLRQFIGHEAFRNQPNRMDMASRVVLWCAARRWMVAEGAPIDHDHPHLSRPVSIVLATTPDPDRRAMAIDAVDYRDPVVHRTRGLLVPGGQRRHHLPPAPHDLGRPARPDRPRRQGHHHHRGVRPIGTPRSSRVGCPPATTTAPAPVRAATAAAGQPTAGSVAPAPPWPFPTSRPTTDSPAPQQLSTEEGAPT